MWFLIAFVIICVIAILIAGLSEIYYMEKQSIFTLIMFTLLLSAFAIIGILISFNPLDVVIKKSSDSDWELYTGNDIKSDTCITQIKIINGVDTVYPTTCYKVLKYESN